MPWTILAPPLQSQAPLRPSDAYLVNSEVFEATLPGGRPSAVSH